MNRTTVKQIYTVMAFYNKAGLPYRRKQLRRLVAIFEDIFEHEPNLGEQVKRVGRRQITGYWRRTKHESARTRQEKYRILKLFCESAELSGRVPKPN